MLHWDLPHYSCRRQIATAVVGYKHYSKQCSLKLPIYIFTLAIALLILISISTSLLKSLHDTQQLLQLLSLRIKRKNTVKPPISQSISTADAVTPPTPPSASVLSLLFLPSLPLHRQGSASALHNRTIAQLPQQGNTRGPLWISVCRLFQVSD